MTTIATIGYENTTVARFLDTLREAEIQVLIDVRAVAGSRRPGFAKTRLSANLQEAGIAYLHLRGLGTPAEGRAAAHAGHHEEMRRIFRDQLATSQAEDDLETVAGLVRGGQRICLLCLEADPEHCHRSLVADALAARLQSPIVHLRPDLREDDAGSDD